MHPSTLNRRSSAAFRRAPILAQEEIQGYLSLSAFPSSAAKNPSSFTVKAKA
jgi:hypothetical protein